LDDYISWWWLHITTLPQPKTPSATLLPLTPVSPWVYRPRLGASPRRSSPSPLSFFSVPLPTSTPHVHALPPPHDCARLFRRPSPHDVLPNPGAANPLLQSSIASARRIRAPMSSPASVAARPAGKMHRYSRTAPLVRFLAPPVRAARFLLLDLVGIPEDGHDWRERRGHEHAGSPTLSHRLLTVNSCIEVRLDLQADKSPVVVKGPFFPRVVNLRHRTVEQCASQGFNLVKQGKLSYEDKLHLIY
jgi:hypothetical protein